MTIINKIVMVVDNQDRILETSDELPGWGRDTLLRASLQDVVDGDGELCRLQTAKGRPEVRVEKRPLPGGMKFVDIVRSC